MARCLSFLGAIIIIIGCSTTSTQQASPPYLLLPPSLANLDQLEGKDPESVEIFLKNYYQQNSDPAVEWWVKYWQAQLWKNSNRMASCRYFSQLAVMEQFALKDLAQLRAHQYCPDHNNIFPDINLKTFVKTPWLKPEAVEIMLHSDRKYTSFPETQIEMHLLAAERSTLQADKIKHLQLALGVAKEKLPLEYEPIQKKLFLIAPHLNPNPERSQWLAVAHDFRTNRKFSKARQWYRKILKNALGTQESDRAYLGLIKSYKLENDKDKYIGSLHDHFNSVKRNYRRNKKRIEDSRRYLEAGLNLSRALWTQGQVALSLKVLDQLSNDLKNIIELSKIYWLYARIAEESKKYNESLQWLQRASVECGTACEFYDKILWHQAWDFRKLRDYAKSSETLQALLSRQPSHRGFESARYRFWLARNLRDQGITDRSEEEFRKLTELDPLGYYGLLAYRELKLPFADNIGQRSPASLPSGQPDSNITSQDLEYLNWLVSTGESRIAHHFLSYITENLKRSQLDDTTTWLKLLYLFARAGSFSGLFSEMSKMAPDTRKELFLTHPRLVFPRPFYDSVSTASAEFGITPELIYSIMRQESAFNAEARSHADAFGLMQILPEVAQNIGHQIQRPLKGPLDLFSPDLNIFIGTAHLRKLWDRFKGQFILTVASYNASDEAIRRWVKTRFNGDPLEFVEDIPYEETSTYIRLVLRNLVFYQRLNSTGTQPVSFPEWCLENIQDFNS